MIRKLPVATHLFTSVPQQIHIFRNLDPKYALMEKTFNVILLYININANYCINSSCLYSSGGVYCQGIIVYCNLQTLTFNNLSKK